MEYLLAAKRNELLQNLEQNLEREIVRQVRNRLNGDDQEESDAHENTRKMTFYFIFEYKTQYDICI